MSTENFNGESDIFNLSADSFINPPKKQSVGLYQPQADDGREGVYESLIRFLPYHKNPNNSKIQKFYVWVDDTKAGEAFSVDCPSTVGKKSILKDTYWKLKNSPSAADQALAQNFSRAENFYSLVQIVKDTNKPELEGKIMVFKFGKKINDKIEAQLKPKFGNPVNPYDLFEGKMFALQISKKQKWNNYDLCEFVGERCPITLPGEKEPIKKVKEDMDKVLAWLKENSPELDKYEYKEWTDEVTEKVHRAIQNIIPDARIVEQILSGAKSDRPTKGEYTSYSQSTSDAINEVASATPEVEKTTSSQKPAGSVGMEDLYAGL